MRTRTAVIWITQSIREYDDPPDMNDNPELLLMSKQGDADFCDEVISLWLAGLAVTKPRHSPEQ